MLLVMHVADKDIAFPEKSTSAFDESPSLCCSSTRALWCAAMPNHTRALVILAGLASQNYFIARDYQREEGGQDALPWLPDWRSTRVRDVT